MNLFDNISKWMSEGNFSVLILMVNFFQTILTIVQVILSIVLLMLTRAKKEEKIKMPLFFVLMVICIIIQH